LYNSPAEVLAGFDVDAPCCAYDGERVWASPRAIVSMMRQSNTVDMTRRSPSYEVRLAKYSSRGFEVYIPGLKRAEIDPTIYERSISRVQGLARLLAIEKLATPRARSHYQQQRGILRGRPTLNNGFITYIHTGFRHNGDLKADGMFNRLELSDYDIVNLHIPYGPGWHARRIEKLIYKNVCESAPYNPRNKNRRLHRHTAFFGTVEECMEDCCEHCPEPKNQEEHNLQDEEDKSYVRGRIAFIEEDPGRQSISGTTAKFFSSISKNDTLAVIQIIEDGEELNRRDHVGRTPLHVAIMSNSVEVAAILIDAGARMTARLVGGRTAFHLAAQMGQPVIVGKMLARKEKQKAKEAAKADSDDPERAERVRMSSEDDWSSEESDDGQPPRKAPANDDPLEDHEEEPDVLDLSISDWDFGLTALGYAILSGSLEVVDMLLAAGADPNFPGRAKNANPLHPLTLTIYTPHEDCGAKIAERLVAAQAIASTADEKLLTIFHRIVASGKAKIVTSLLSCDPTAKKVLDIPAWSGYGLMFPVVSAILAGDYAMLSVLLAHGARLVYSPEDVSRAEEKRTRSYLPRVTDFRGRIYFPVEVALLQRDEVISLLAAVGAAVESPIKASIGSCTTDMSILQWTSRVVTLVPSTTVSKQKHDFPTSPADVTWSQYRAHLASILPQREPAWGVQLYGTPRRNKNEEYILATKDYYVRAESILRAHGAALPAVPQVAETGRAVNPQGSAYLRHTKYSPSTIPIHLKVFYDELFEACWTGDNASIQELCLPKEEKEGQGPIQISVQTTPLRDGLGGLTGWTPLLVALHRRHWETARLVLAIAIAQYQAPESKGSTFTDTLSAILDDDSDEESPDSDEEDDYSEQKEINFTDITARPSPVRTEVPANKMLQACSLLLGADGKCISCNPLQKSIIEDDFEAFVQGPLVRILDLYQSAGVAIWPDVAVYELAVTLDRPGMVDELIRHSGIGIPIPSDTKKSPTKPAEERVYLGLKVGGKRRVDIIQQTQTHKTITYNYALLYNAISSGATKVVEYLAGPRPLAAYAYYAVTHNDDIAQFLKMVDNLEAALPDLLGWKVDELNESPLLGVVINGKLDILKQMFSLKPNLMEEALHQRSKFVGFNALLTAAFYCSSTEIVDFLLERGCNPSERDARGWNIYHLACLSQHAKRANFVAHLLKTLPVELTHELLAQTSKGASNTPLMLAVKRGYIATTRAIVNFGIDPVILMIKDAHGSTPLHIAAQNTNTVLAEILLHHGPVELLYTENCVGQTPLDIGCLKNLPRVTGSTEVRKPGELELYPEQQLANLLRTAPFNLEKQNVEIPKLRTTLDRLFADGLLVHGSNLATELVAFADYMEGKLATETTKSVEGKEIELDPVASQGSTMRMYIMLRDAAAARPGSRQLVHIADVQRSVQRNLAQGAVETPVSGAHCWQTNNESKGVDPEEQHITQLKRRSLFASPSQSMGNGFFESNGEIDLFAEDKI
ncbi:ankyrin repeat-containing domain protein, partial [Lactifluus volemus]